MGHSVLILEDDMVVNSPVVRRRIRKIALYVHLCVGLLLGLYFSLMGLTGSTLVFKSEIHRFLKPSAYFVAVPANAAPLPLDRLTQGFRDGHPQCSISFLTLPTATNQALIVGYKLSTLGQKRPQSMQTLLDPYSGRVVAEQLSGGLFFRTVHNLHARLLLDDLGADFHRYAVFALFALLLSGAWLWWSTKKISIKIDGTFNRKIFDTHNVVGFFAGAFLFVLALTACGDIWREQTKAVVAGLTGAPLPIEEKVTKVGDRGHVQSPYDAMLAAAKAARPDMVAVAITDKYRVRMANPNDLHILPYVVPRCVTVVCNQSDGSLSKIEDPAAMPVGQQILAWLLPIHFGQWGPGISYYFVKAVWFIVGLCPSILFASGVMIVLLKRGVKLR